MLAIRHGVGPLLLLPPPPDRRRRYRTLATAIQPLPAAGDRAAVSARAVCHCGGGWRLMLCGRLWLRRCELNLLSITAGSEFLSQC